MMFMLLGAPLGGGHVLRLVFRDSRRAKCMRAVVHNVMVSGLGVEFVFNHGSQTVHRTRAFTDLKISSRRLCEILGV